MLGVAWSIAALFGVSGFSVVHGAAFISDHIRDRICGADAPNPGCLQGRRAIRGSAPLGLKANSPRGISSKMKNEGQWLPGLGAIGQQCVGVALGAEAKGGLAGDFKSHALVKADCSGIF